MPRQTQGSRAGIASRWGRILRRKMSEALLGGEVAERLDAQEQALVGFQQQLADSVGTYPAGRAADLEPILAWMRGAEAHLSALQTDVERLADMVRQLSAKDDESVLAWMRGAETHLAALQGDHERLMESQRRQAAQLDRVTARAAGLHARITDLQRVDTEVALTIARRRNAEPWG